MANVLPAEKQLHVLSALVNGCSIRAAERITDVHRDTIMRFGARVGEGCERLHNRLARNLSCPLIDLDEQHSWCARRPKNVDPAKHDESASGEQWTWASICRTSKFIISWVVGKRTQENADKLVADTRARLVVMPQITTDGLSLYEKPIAKGFGPAVPYMQTVKKFTGRGSDRTGTAEKYAPEHGVKFIEKRLISGLPDEELATTYAIERSNLTNRQWNARLGRRTLSFSKLVERHRAAVALMYVYRNFCHIQRNMKASPAMMANVTDRLWSLEELLDAALSSEPCAAPEPSPLLIPKPEGVAKALPGDRGWLRLMPNVKGGPSAPRPSPAPQAPTTAPALAVAPPPPWQQLDLLTWTPPKPPLS